LSRNKADVLELRQEVAINAQNTQAEMTIKTITDSHEGFQKEFVEKLESLIRSNKESHNQTRKSLLYALGQARSTEMSILYSLRFPTMRDRRLEIPEAHRRTFGWIYDESRVGDWPWDNFVEWLERGSGLYWINGKAGSGKSTLMRYIFDNEKTRHHLRVWAQNSQLEIAGFFFWNSGSVDQRSQTGLFRSLLFQALHTQPDLVCHIFPQEYAEASSTLGHGLPLEWNWSLASLKAAFKRWIDFAPASSKLCFFIDGLDEYAGEQEEIVEFFKTISSSTINHIKICVSSRPWVVFDEAFESLPSLRLQDLTLRDITSYVEDELQGHRKMQLPREEFPDDAAALVNEIVTKASGVFLWVAIVVRSLLHGLRNRDDIEILQKRLRELPSDLATLYSHMLGVVEPLYQGQASKIFRIFDTMAHVHEWVNPLELELATTESSLQPAEEKLQNDMTDREIQSRCEKLSTHLKTRCAGLLEKTEIIDYHDGNIREMSSKVNYLHRTVKEFLETQDGRKVLVQSEGADFNPDISAISSCITRLKRYVFIDSSGRRRIATTHGIWTCILRAMKYARSADISGNTSYIAAMEELKSVAMRLWEKERESTRNIEAHKWESFDEKEFLNKAIEHQLLAYVRAKIRNNKSNILWAENQLRLLLVDIIRSFVEDPGRILTIEELLEIGVNPNQLWKGNSPWQHFLTLIHSKVGILYSKQFDLSAQARIFKSMLEHGASPFTTCTWNHQVPSRMDHFGSESPRAHFHTIEAVIDDVFEQSERVELKTLLNERILKSTSQIAEAHPKISWFGVSTGKRMRGVEEQASRKRKAFKR
jgi:hypothetical protein